MSPLPLLFLLAADPDQVVIDDFAAPEPVWRPHADGGQPPAITPVPGGLRLTYAGGGTPGWGNVVRPAWLSGAETEVRFRLRVLEAADKAGLHLWLWETDGDGWLSATIPLTGRGDQWQEVVVSLASLRFQPRGDGVPDRWAVDRLMIGCNYANLTVELADLRFTGPGVAAARAGGPAGRPGADELSVAFNDVIQPDFLGVNGVYHGFCFMPEQTLWGMSEADCQREFDRVERLRLNIARTWYRSDWCSGDSLFNPFDWQTPKMLAFERWLAAMRERNVDVALQAAWWIGSDPTFGGQLADWRRFLPRYAEWVSESLHQLIEVKGYTNIKYLVLLTEPIQGYQKEAKPADFATVEEYYRAVCEAVDARLRADGRRQLTRLVGPNSHDHQITWAVENLRETADILSGHGYNYPDYAAWFAKCAGMVRDARPAGKPVWLDECGKQDEKYRETGDYGTHVAEITAAALNAGVQCQLLWLLFDQRYVATGRGGVLTDTSPKPNLVEERSDYTGRDSFYRAVHRWGLAYWPADTLADATNVRPVWYAYSALSRYLGGRGGTQVVRCRGGRNLQVAATRRGDETTLLVVNSRPEPATLTVNLSPPLNRDLRRHLYDPAAIVCTPAAEILPTDKILPAVGASFTDILPGRGVALYTTRPD